MALESEIFRIWHELSERLDQLNAELLKSLQEYAQQRSQKELAQRMDRSQAFINDILHERRKITAEIWKRAEEALRDA